MSVQFDYQGFGVLAQWSGALGSSNAASAFADIATAGSNSVGLCPELLVQTSTSSRLVTDPAKSTTDASLIAGIKAAQAQGLKVLLEPHILGLDGTSSGSLKPSDTAAFFASYKAQIVHLATIAQATGVDTFSIGNEMGSLSGSAYQAQWQDVIASVRQVYSGKLTYEAATNEASSVSFWDKLDVIGFNAYLSLSASANPTVADLEKAWTTAPANDYMSTVLNGQSVIDFMHSLSTTYGKQVLVTEIGYRSIDGAATNPGNPTEAASSEIDQANAYKAMFQALQSQGGTWLAGVELWDYSLNSGSISGTYSPVGKQAMGLIQQYFSGAGAVAGLSVAGSAASDLVDVGSGNDVIYGGLGNDVIRAGAGDDTIAAGPDQTASLKTTTVTITGYGTGGQVALLINGQQVGATATFTPAADTSGYQTYTFTFANPDQIKSLDLSLLNAGTGVNAKIRSITINGASLNTNDVTNPGAQGTFNLYTKSIHLDGATYKDYFYGQQSDDDLIQGGAGNDTINGGSGADTAVYSGTFASYGFARSGNSLIVTDGVAGRDGRDTLSNVEYLQFSDGAVAVASLQVADVGSSTVTALMSPLLSHAGFTTASTARLTQASVQTPQIVADGISAANAAVTLWNGATRLASTTADAAGAYSFSLSGLAPGVYSLTTKASLGSLGSAASNAACLVIGSSSTIASLIASASTTPSAIYLTDPANPIVASVAQLRAISPALSRVGTGVGVAVADTAAAVLAAMDLLATQTNLASVTLTGAPVFAVSLSTMRHMIADDASVLAKIQGGYSFSVTSGSTTTLYNPSGTQASYTQGGLTGQPYTSQTFTTDASGKTTSVVQYYASGIVYATRTNAADGSTTVVQNDTAGHRVLQRTTFANGSTDTVTYDAASGAKLTDTVVDTAGTRYTQYGIKGQPYTSQTFTTDTSGKTTSVVQYYAGGIVYATRTNAADGSNTLVQNDTAGHRVLQRTTFANGSTDSVTYDAASGAKLTDTVVDTAGTRYTQYGIQGQPYTSQTFSSTPAGVTTSVVQYYASGIVYATRTNAADGSNTLVQNDTAGHRVLQRTTFANGSTDSVTYDAASGAKLTDTVVDTAGTRYTQYGIQGQPYTSQTFSSTPAGVTTSVVQYYASGIVYTTRTNAADGSTTTVQNDTAGHRVLQRTTFANGSTDTVTYDAASGAKLTDTVVDTAGTRYTQYGIQGQPYTSQTFSSTPAGVTTSVVQYYASGIVCATRTNAADGSTTTVQNDTAGHRVLQRTTFANGSTDTLTYDSAGTKTGDTLVDAAGTHYTQYGVTGRSYTSQTFNSDVSGKMTSVVQYYDSGAVYSKRIYASDGSSTQVQYDAAGLRTQQSTTFADGSTNASSYSASGATLSTTITDAAGKHFTQFGITGQPYTSQLTDQDTSGKLLDTTQFYADGSTTTRFYAAGVTKSFSGASDTIIAFGGDTMIFGQTPFRDTIQSFHAGDAAGHDTIVLSKALAADFSHLSISMAGSTSTITLDAQHTIALTNPIGTLTASDFRFV